MNFPSIPLQKVSGKFPEVDETILFPVKLDRADQIIYDPRHRWKGQEDFSCELKPGWNDRGLVFRLKVKDCGNIINTMPDPGIWQQDGIELYIAAPGAKIAGCDRLHIMVAPPERNGKVRTFVFAHGGNQAARPVEAAGKRFDGGWELQLIVPWSTLGEEFRKEGAVILMQMMLNDFVPDYSTPLCLTMNGKGDCSAQSENYLRFRLTEKPEYGEECSLDLEWNPDIRMLGDNLALALPENVDRVKVTLCDDKGKELGSGEFSAGAGNFLPSGIEKLAVGGGFLHFVCFRQGKAAGSVVRIFTYMAPLLKAVESAGLREMVKRSPWKVAHYFQLISAIEFLKIVTEQSSPLRKLALAECAARLALLEDRPIPDSEFPQLKMLELTRGSAAQISVAFSRYMPADHVHFTAITLPWGNLWSVNAELYTAQSEAEAAAFCRAYLAYRRQEKSPELPGADEVYSCWGFQLGDGTAPDLQTDRLVTLFSRIRPGQGLRLRPEEAFNFNITGICIQPDTPAAMREKIVDFALAKELPLITLQEVPEHELALICGSVPSTLVSFYWHSYMGIPNRALIFRKGCMVFATSFNHPELDLEFARFLLAGKPVTPELARRFAGLRGKFIPGRSAAPAEGKELWNGDVHVHSIYSDGTGTPAGILANLPEVGFDYMVLSDHHRIKGAQVLADGLQKSGCGLNLICGEEITMSPKYHINLYPLKEWVDCNQDYPKLMAEARRQGAILQFNHPMTYGTSMSDLWYGDFLQADVDAVERRLEHLEKWKISGRKFPAIVGSTDTHLGIFGYWDTTVVLAEKFSPESLAQAVRQGETAMLDPFLPDLVYGSNEVIQAVKAAFEDPEYPARFAGRLARALEKFDALEYIRLSPVVTGLDHWCTTIDQDYRKKPEPIENFLKRR